MTSPRKIYDGMIAGFLQQVETLPASTIARMGPLFAAAQSELEKDLRTRLLKFDGADTFTTHRYRMMLAQVRRGMEKMRAMEPALVEGLRIGSNHAGLLATNHLEQEVLRMSAFFEDTWPMIDIDSAALLAKTDNLLISQFESSVARYVGEVLNRIAAELSISRIRGETINEVTSRLRKALPRTFARARSDAARVARTEIMNGYNTTHHNGLLELAEDDDGYLMMWDAAADRACPQCSKLDGQVVGLNDEFAAKWRRSPKGKSYSSTHRRPPAHPYCRCILAAWHADWKRLPRRPQLFKLGQRVAA